jgi:hypothetical protein
MGTHVSTRHTARTDTGSAPAEVGTTHSEADTQLLRHSRQSFTHTHAGDPSSTAAVDCYSSSLQFVTVHSYCAPHLRLKLPRCSWWCPVRWLQCCRLSPLTGPLHPSLLLLGPATSREGSALPILGGEMLWCKGSWRMPGGGLYSCHHSSGGISISISISNSSFICIYYGYGSS